MTTPAEITTTDRDAAQTQKAEAEDYLKELDGFTVDDQEDLELAAESLKEVKSRVKRLDEMKKRITDPMNEAIKEVRKLFAPPIDYWGQCERKLKKAIAVGHERAHEKQKKALKAVAEASQAGDTERAAAAMEAAARSDFEPVKGLSIRHTFDFEIEDFDAVPDEYKVVDEAKVKAVIRAHKGAVNIPGIKVVRKSSIASGSR